jgi:NitT/TauT family transport system permease protein
MRSRALPVLAVCVLLVAFWYVMAMVLNAPFARDQASRDDRNLTLPQLAADTLAQDRPRLPAPHQVGRALWDGIAGQKVTSKRSLVYHGLVTLKATLLGFGLGILLGGGLAIAIVRLRVMDLSVMPWAIISQTVPIVALAPMIVALMNALGVDDRLIAKAVISAYLSFFPVLVSMVTGLRSPDAMQLDLLRTWNATTGQTFRKLRLPAAMPFAFAALKVAIAAALVGAIVGELPTGAIEGLGARMLIGSQFGDPMSMWSALFAAAILAGLLILALGLAERLMHRLMGAAP